LGLALLKTDDESELMVVLVEVEDESELMLAVV